MVSSALPTVVTALGTYSLLIVALILAVVLAGTAVSHRLDVAFTRMALILFGDYVTAHGRRQNQRTTVLRGARVAITYRVYAAKTILYALGVALVGGFGGIYLIGGVVQLLALEPATIRAALPAQLDVLATFAGLDTLSPRAAVPLFTVSALTVGAASGVVTYWVRWWYPDSVGDARATRIDATMPQIVAFVYALARSGMEFPQVMRIIARHSDTFGAAAEEFEVGARHMDIFGRDLVSAVRLMGDRSPSETFREFAENLASVLQSGRNLESFLEEQHQEFQDEAEAQQQQLLTLLSTLAETYVTLFVAGPLFLITILVIIGLAGAETFRPLQVIVYLILPAGNIAFLAYLNSVMGGFGGGLKQSGRELAITATPQLVSQDLPHASSGRPDGGQPATAIHRRVTLATRVQWVRARLADPLQTFRQRPEAILYLTVPVMVLVTPIRVYLYGSITIGVIEDVLIQAVLVVAGTFAVAYEYHYRYLRRIERAMPDFLARLASLNQAGMTLIKSIRRVREGELGALGPEVDRLWADIQWGATIDTAMKQFANRIKTATVNRIIILITNAMSASGNIAQVLRIAATQGKSERTLKRERRQEMLTYTIVIYISFAVFLVIIIALDQVLLPNLPESGIGTNGGTVGIPTSGLAGFGDVNVAGFQQLFRHAAYVQAVTTGAIAGQMSRGNVRAGALHITILLGVAYVTFTVL